MKDILINGHRLLTTDEIADAVLNYARVLTADGAIDVVHFPTLHDGEYATCSLLLSGAATVAVVDATVVFSPTLPGAERAVAEIESRAAAVH